MAEVKNDRGLVNYGGFLNIFSYDVWICILLTFLVQLFFIFASETSSKRDLGFDSAKDNIFWVVDPSLPKSLASRIAFLSGTMTFFVCFAAYNADLTAYLTVVPKPPELDSYSAIADSDHAIRTWKGGLTYRFFGNFEGSNHHAQIYSKLQESSEFYQDCDVDCVVTKLKV